MYESENSEPHPDFNASYLDVAFCYMQLHEKMFLHASVIYTFLCNFAWL